jgi:hypothetical protein
MLGKSPELAGHSFKEYLSLPSSHIFRKLYMHLL